MRAAMLFAPHGLRMVEVELPVPGPREMLICVLVSRSIGARGRGQWSSAATICSGRHCR